MPFDGLRWLERRSTVPERVSREVRLGRKASDVRALTVVALANGGWLDPENRPDGPQRALWNVAGGCEAPVSVLQTGEGHFRMDLGHGASQAWEPMRSLQMFVRCRKCGPCLNARSYRWGMRAVSEWLRGALEGQRTWFGTLTFRPEERYRIQAATEWRLNKTR